MLYIEKDGKRLAVPQEVEAEGGAAIEKWLAEQTKSEPKPKGKAKSEEAEA